MLKVNKNKVFVIHDFDGRTYYRALEVENKLIYLNSRPFRFFFRDIIKHRTLKIDTLKSLFYFFTIPFRSGDNVILAMAPYNFRFIFYSYLCRKNKVVYHTSWPYWQEVTPFYYSEKLNSILKLIWVGGLTKFYKKIAVTTAAQKSLSTFLDQGEVEQIYHVVDCQQIPKEILSKKWNESFNIGFLGRICPEKGVDLFIQLSNSFISKEINYWIAGSGSSIKDVEKESSSRNDFDYIGFLNERSKVSDFLRGLNFLILPSLKSDKWEELFGLVIIEAMSQGVIVITTDHVGPCEIINSGIDGFVISEILFVETAVNIINNDQNKYSFEYIASNAVLRAADFSLPVICEKWKIF